MQKKYTHYFSVGFSVESDNKPENVTKEELWKAFSRRYRELEASGEIAEACGMPVDSERNPVDHPSLPRPFYRGNTLLKTDVQDALRAAGEEPVCDPLELEDQFLSIFGKGISYKGNDEFVFLG